MWISGFFPRGESKKINARVLKDVTSFLSNNTGPVRKIGPRSNKIKQMQKQNTEDTQYKRDTDLRGSPSVGYVHQRNCQVLPLLLSSKMKG
jgi:hypothetical protein